MQSQWHFIAVPWSGSSLLSDSGLLLSKMGPYSDVIALFLQRRTNIRYHPNLFSTLKYIQLHYVLFDTGPNSIQSERFCILIIQRIIRCSYNFNVKHRLIKCINLRIFQPFSQGIKGLVQGTLPPALFLFKFAWSISLWPFACLTSESGICIWKLRLNEFSGQVNQTIPMLQKQHRFLLFSYECLSEWMRERISGVG